MADFKVHEGVNSNYLVLEDQSSEPSGYSDKNVIFSKPTISGGTGIWFKDGNNSSDELVSKAKAMAFGLVL
tara:strand:+ start:354 stop:566 length:213 start_codon:yes stop_codon:yes gene_type:complete